MNGACPMLKQNESSTDRIIRVVIGAIALGIGVFALTGIAQMIAYIIGAVALVTGAVGFCGLYALLGISTKAEKKLLD